MTDRFPYKFNVDQLEHADVVGWLRSNMPKHRYLIARREMIGDITLEEWQASRIAATALASSRYGDNHCVTDAKERATLLLSDNLGDVELDVLGHPSKTSQRTLNRVAIQCGVNAAGITRHEWSAAFKRGLDTYLIQFADKNDAVMFKLAMWKRPDEDEW